MKNFKILFAFFALSLITYQCQIGPENYIENQDLEYRVLNECEPSPCSGQLIPAAIEDIPLPEEYASPWLDCELSGKYMVQFCDDDEIRFFDFEMYFEASCEWLINQLESPDGRRLYLQSNLFMNL